MVETIVHRPVRGVKVQALPMNIERWSSWIRINDWKDCLDGNRKYIGWQVNKLEILQKQYS